MGDAQRREDYHPRLGKPPQLLKHWADNDFYDDAFGKIADKYGTINKELRGRELWRTLSEKTNDNEEKKYYQDPFGYYAMREELEDEE